MTILALNPGSSTLKYALYRGEKFVSGETLEGHPTADVLRRVKDVEAVGVRVVHGGSRFEEPAVVDDAVIGEIEKLSDIAPLHNPLALEVIREVRRTLDVPVVAVFDTAFHQTMPPVAFTYAIPSNVPVRRYGFHGISYAYIASRLSRPKMIVCHLGNGASVCAMRDGKSIDTSMGFTPMEGLVMGTRSGDIDPGAILYLLRNGRGEPDLDRLLNRESGLLGVSGVSGDMREIESAAKSGNERARLALDLFAYRVAKYVGAYAVALDGLDALVFTAGIGEHSSSMRSRICARLGPLGIQLDDSLNGAALKEERKVSSGRVEVWVIPTNEELEIVRATRARIGS